MTKSPIGLGKDDERWVYPKLQDHPRRGIPAHGKPDTQPESGGEFFRSRGIGLEHDLNCFVCGGEQTLRHNIAAFVQTKAAGERVVAMFEHGARLDYRDHEPDRVQVKIGACDKYLPCLLRLDELTHQADGVLSAEIIIKATS